ncbi:uncharacterized protein TNCV_4392831 [Trichonephila clavipes]|nr:uncharacterized protein TNCV_4392831 [Trichonephila clavipes]
MAQRKHLDDFLPCRIIDDWNVGTQLEVAEELGIAQSVISRLWQRFQDDVPSTRYHQERTSLKDTVTMVQGWSSFGERNYSWFRTNLHFHSVTMTQATSIGMSLWNNMYVCFGVQWVRNFLFMDDNARPHRANIVDECLQSEG